MSDEIEPTGKALRVVEYLRTEFRGTAKVFENHIRGGLSFRIMGVARALEAIGKDVALMLTSEGLRSLPIEELRR